MSVSQKRFSCALAGKIARKAAHAIIFSKFSFSFYLLRFSRLLFKLCPKAFVNNFVREAIKTEYMMTI